jgi:hypothetical protein
MSGWFSLDKVGLVAIVARLKKHNRDAVLRMGPGWLSRESHGEERCRSRD